MDTSGDMFHPEEAKETPVALDKDKASKLLESAASIVLTLRDKKKAIQERHKEELRPYNDRLDQFEQALRSLLDRLGAESVNTKAGTVYALSHKTVTVEDWDTLFDFVHDNKLWHFLEHKAAKKATLEYLEEHDKLPPGVKLSVFNTASVRRK